MGEREACCLCEAAPTLVLACSGASNVGQIANNLMIELDRRGIGNGYCLAGVGGAPLAAGLLTRRTLVRRYGLERYRNLLFQSAVVLSVPWGKSHRCRG